MDVDGNLEYCIHLGHTVCLVKEFSLIIEAPDSHCYFLEFFHTIILLLCDLWIYF